MAIKNEILDELLKDKDPKTIFSSEGLLGELKKALAERVLNAEMDHHLADSTQEEVCEAEKTGNRRNGYSKEDGADGERGDGACDPARPARRFRAAVDCEVPTPLSWIRRQDRLDVRPWHERTGDPGSICAICMASMPPRS